ncbi:alpha/beta hydrolase family protein [Tenacibaculum dicentrarchi]|uniref:alpha/beta hydrolase family protein n=1 Tax=Tenacibaculum dicentrarchi TaxID=669041 RepID=UPI000C7B9728|nr:Lysophospholipase [Tenacibaculum dicentrarchi]
MNKPKYIFCIFLLFYINVKGQDIYRNISGGKLFGKLEKSKTNNKILFFFIQGSGPTDLDGNSTFINCNNLKMLSDSLLKKGYSTFRYDKRGIGNSKIKNINENNFTIELLVNDIVDWIKHLKKMKKFSQIYLLGHSEGSLLAGLVSEKTKIDGIISISGTRLNAQYILKEQFVKQYPSISQKAIVIIDSLSNGYKVKKVPPSLHSVFRPSVQPYLISWFKHTPLELYKTINCNILILHGNLDSQVEIKNRLIINRDNVKSILVPNMNHLMKAVTNEYEDKESYTTPNYVISSKLIIEIDSFIEKKTTANNAYKK